MEVDVVTEVVIRRPRADVAAYATDPANAPEWYANIKSAMLHTAPPLSIGSQVGFSARFLGRNLDYVYKIADLIPGERLVMRTAGGPFAMETTYGWEDTGDGATRMTLRNRGRPAGFGAIVAPVMEMAMRRANRKDLDRLRAILESSP